MIIIRTENSIAEYSSVYFGAEESMCLNDIEPDDDGLVSFYGVRVPDGEEVFLGDFTIDVCKSIIDIINFKLENPIIKASVHCDGKYSDAIVPYTPIINLSELQ